MVNYSRSRLEGMIAALDLPVEGNNTSAKGRRLQDLAEYLLDRIPGVAVTGQNIVNATASQELDLRAEHDNWRSGLKFEWTFPVECKNEASKTSAQEIREFAEKIRSGGGFDGLLITRRGLAGGGPSESAHDAIRFALHDQIRIAVIVVDELAGLRTTQDLVNLINKRYRELRNQQAYLTV